MLEKSGLFLSSDQPSEPKSLDVALNIAGVEKYARKTCEEAIRFEFWTKRSISDGGNLCPLWSVILKSVWNNVLDTFKLRCTWPWAVVSCTLLAAVPWTGLEHSHRKARLCVYLSVNSDFFLFFASLNINQCVKNFLPVKEVEFIKWINLINVLLVGFVKQWFSAFRKTHFVFGLSRSTADCSRIFSKKETALSFFFLLDYASRTCSMPRMYFFLHLSFAQSCKILSKFSKLSAILKHRGKNFVMMTSIVHMSSNRS